MNIGNLSAAHAFNYIVLRVKPGLISCEDFAMALIWVADNIDSYIDWIRCDTH